MLRKRTKSTRIVNIYFVSYSVKVIKNAKKCHGNSVKNNNNSWVFLPPVSAKKIFVAASGIWCYLYANRVRLKNRIWRLQLCLADNWSGGRPPIKNLSYSHRHSELIPYVYWLLMYKMIHLRFADELRQMCAKCSPQNLWSPC